MSAAGSEHNVGSSFQKTDFPTVYGRKGLFDHLGNCKTLFSPHKNCKLLQDPIAYARRLNDRHRQFYRSIASGGNAKFLQGWLNRAESRDAFINNCVAV